MITQTKLSSGPKTAILRVRMLGPPHVEWADRSSPSLRRRQVRALLYHLATRLTPVPREQLCGLFWPDIPDCTARRNLSHLLTHLRRTLPSLDLIDVVADQIALNPDYVWSDTMIFENLCTVPGPHYQITLLKEAVELYRGPFLAGISLATSPDFEMWVTTERGYWERLYLEALVSLIDAETARGHHHAAIDYAQRYLAVNDLAEEIHRCLILLYTTIGDRQAAQHQFEHLTISLERELGVSPLPETRAAYQAILEDHELPSPQLIKPAPAWIVLPSLEAPLVGRDRAWRCLRQAYTAVRSGHGQVVLISGEPGIGKTRLMQDFVLKLGDEATIAVGSGHQVEQRLPYWPLIEALRPHLPAISQAGIEPVYLAELTRLWPKLHALCPDLPTPIIVDPTQEYGRLLQALTNCILNLAGQERPLILCFDDLHWADQTTLVWLTYLARQIDQACLLVVGAYRSENTSAITALEMELRRLGLWQEIRLAGLSSRAVLQLIRQLAGQTRGVEALSELLCRETAGNPFFILELLRTLFEAGTLQQAEAGWSQSKSSLAETLCPLPLPETVCETVRARLARLNRLTYQILEVGAVIGSRFSLDLVKAASGRQEQEMIGALEELIARQIIDADNGQYHFKHNLVRTIVYHDLSYGRRRLLHRRVAEVLVKMEPDRTAVLSWQFEQAEKPGQAARYALQAGLAAKRVFAYTEAKNQFDRTLKLLEQEASQLQEPAAITANQQLRVQALASRGWALRLLGNMEAYARDTRTVAELARQLGDQGTLAHLRWREAYTQRWFCRYTAAAAAAKEGLHLAQAAGDSVLAAMCQREVGLAARETGNYLEAQSNLVEALRLFVDLNETVAEIHTMGNLSTLHCRQGEYERAIKLARQALNRCEAADLPLERRLPLGDLGAAATQAGDAELARHCLLESLAIAQQIADRTQEIFCLGHLGWLCLRLKRPPQAGEFFQEALVLAENINSRAEQSWLWSGLAEAHRLSGDLDLALEQVRQILELAQATGRPYDQELALQILVKLGQINL